MEKKKVIYTIVIAVAVWGAAVVAGWFMLSGYENAPGQAQAAPQRWPSESRISRAPGLPTMVMFLHPHCPCSRASVAELSLIMAHCQDKVKVHAVFLRPKGFSQDWVQTGLWKDAGRIPGVDVIEDNEGRESGIFHADVSGQTMLYDSKGDLVFSGGITVSRGHEGDNDGKDSIVSFLTRGIILQKQTPFFGCLLSDRPQRS